MLALVLAPMLGCFDLGSRTWDTGVSPAARPDASGPSDLRGAPEGIDGSTPGADTAAGDPGSTGAPDADAPCPHPGAAHEEVQVEMVYNAFNPDRVTLCAGDTVTWTNHDTKEHVVVTGEPGAPSGLMKSPKLFFGDTFSFVFDDPGEYVYYCSTHKKKMSGAWVIVR